jgi:hypothetical protein
LGGFGAKPTQVQRVPEKIAEKDGFGNLWYRAGSCSIDLAAGFQHLASQHTSKKIIKIKHRNYKEYHQN